jgi:hypothetical protein
MFFLLNIRKAFFSFEFALSRKPAMLSVVIMILGRRKLNVKKSVRRRR